MTKNHKLTLELPLLLPDIPDTKDRCVSTLMDALSARSGILEAHVLER